MGVTVPSSLKVSGMSPNVAVPVLTTCGGAAALGFLAPKRWKRTRTSSTSPTIPTMIRTRFLRGDEETFSASSLIGFLHEEIQLAWNTAPQIRSSDSITGHRCTANRNLSDRLDGGQNSRTRTPIGRRLSGPAAKCPREAASRGESEQIRDV